MMTITQIFPNSLSIITLPRYVYYTYILPNSLPIIILPRYVYYTYILPKSLSIITLSRYVYYTYIPRSAPDLYMGGLSKLSQETCHPLLFMSWSSYWVHKNVGVNSMGHSFLRSGQQFL